MRKTGRVILCVTSGALLSLGIAFGPGGKALAYSEENATPQQVLFEYNPEKGYGIEELSDVDEKGYGIEQAQQAESGDNSAGSGDNSAGSGDAGQKQADQAIADYISEGSKADSMIVDGVKSQVKGLYYLDDIKGLAIIPDQSYNNADVVVYETNEQKSPQAYASVKEILAVEAPGAVAGPGVNIKFNVPEEAKDSKLVGKMKFGIAAPFAKDGSNYAVMAIYSGGQYQIFKDTDDNPGTISIDVTVDDMNNTVLFALIRLD